MSQDARRTASARREQPAPIRAQTALWIGVGVSLAVTALIWALDYRFDDLVLLPDQGASWYYWKLPEPTAITRATAWLGYTLHQLAFWWLIFKAQRARPAYTAELHGINIALLGMNTLFVFLHFLQTHLWYDGLAQDVSIWSSQWSVILLLVVVLLMEIPRRGLFFGRRPRFKAEIYRAVRKYHGYVFAWAIVYTFWYHPMVGPWSHLIGFFYMFLLMIQGSLVFTRSHLNRYWTVVLEVMVLFHGTLVAMQQGNDLWPMFFFGFAGIFVITQMHGLGLSAASRAVIGAAYVVLVIAVYSQRGWRYLNEIVRIPAIEYLSVFVLAGIVWLMIRGVTAWKARGAG